MVFNGLARSNLLVSEHKLKNVFFFRDGAVGVKIEMLNLPARQLRSVLYRWQRL